MDEKRPISPFASRSLEGSCPAGSPALARASGRPSATAILGPPAASTATAPATWMKSASESCLAPFGSVSPCAFLARESSAAPYLSPPFSGRSSSRRMLPFAPPVLFAPSQVPASWKAIRTSTPPLLGSTEASVFRTPATAAARAASAASGEP